MQVGGNVGNDGVVYGRLKQRSRSLELVIKRNLYFRLN